MLGTRRGEVRAIPFTLPHSTLSPFQRYFLLGEPRTTHTPTDQSLRLLGLSPSKGRNLPVRRVDLPLETVRSWTVVNPEAPKEHNVIAQGKAPRAPASALGQLPPYTVTNPPIRRLDLSLYLLKRLPICPISDHYSVRNATKLL